jgi:hypothetical protein
MGQARKTPVFFKFSRSPRHGSAFISLDCGNEPVRGNTPHNCQPDRGQTGLSWRKRDRMIDRLKIHFSRGQRFLCAMWLVGREPRLRRQ